jgi:hypothetical protein
MHVRAWKVAGVARLFWFGWSHHEFTPRVCNFQSNSIPTAWGVWAATSPSARQVCVCVCVLVKTLTVASARRTDIPPHKAVVAQSSEGSGAKGESESPLRLLITLPPTVWSAPLHPCATSSRCWASRKQLSVKWAGRVFGLARLACPVAA